MVMTSRNEPFVKALRRFGLLAGASESTLRGLASSVGARRVARGVCLWRAGMRADQVVLLQNGYLSARGSSGGAARSVFAFTGPGEVANAEFVLRWGVHAAGAYVSSERVDLLVLEASTLERFAHEDPALRRALEGAAARGSGSLALKLKVLRAGDAPPRFATLLSSVAERYGQAQPGGEVRVLNAPSLPDLASYAGIAADVATGLLARWTAQGIVRLEAGALLVEAPPALKALAQSEGTATVCGPSRSSGVICRAALRGEPVPLRALPE